MAITGTANLSTDIAAHKRLMYWSLRPQLFFDPIADVDSTNSTSNGASVSFYFTADMAAAITPLTEAVDITPTTITDSVITLTLSEYGNSAQTTALMRGTSFLDVQTTLAHVIGFNAGLSVDTLAVNVLAAGTNVAYSNGAGVAFVGTEAARNRLAITDNFNGAMVRYATAKLRGANVDPWMDGMYRGYMHPDVAYDFKGSTGGTNWSDPHIYSAPEAIFNGVVGAFQGVVWIETPRAPLFADAGDGVGGAGLIDSYGSLVCGRQAMAKAFSQHPEYGQQPVWVDTPEIDQLRRFKGAGWKHLVKYGIFRQAALYRLESSSSIGTNV